MVTSISVILPSYAEPIETLIQSISFLENFFNSHHIDYEIIIVRNGPYPLNHASIHNIHVKYVYTKEAGQGIAFRLGAAKATKKYILLTSVDIPYGLSDLDQFIHTPETIDLVMGSKNHPNSIYKINWVRKTISRIEKVIIHSLFPGFPVSDPNGSFFLKSQVGKPIIHSTTSLYFFFCFELVYKIWRLNHKITELPVTYIKKNKQTSVRIVHDSLHYLWQLLKLKFSEIRVSKLFLCYIALSFIYCLPLIFYQQNIAGLWGDNLTHAATTSWFCDNFFIRNFHTNELFAPFGGGNLSNGYDMPLLQTLACPLRPLGAIAMFNFIAWIQISLLLFSAYYAAKTWIKNRWLQVGFIFLYSFSGFTLFRSQVHLNLLSTVWGTALCLTLISRTNFKQLRSVVLTMLVITGTFISSWQNIPNLTLPIFVLFTAAFIRTNHKQLMVRNVLISVVMCGLAALPFLHPIISGYQHTFTKPDYSSIKLYHADILSFIIPYDNHWIWKLFPMIQVRIHEEKLISFDIVFIIFIGLFAVIKSLRQFRLSPKTKVWILIVFLNMLTSFGTFIGFLSHQLIPLPYYTFISKFPPYSITRTPARMAIVTLFVGYIFMFQYIEHLQRNSNKRSIKYVPIIICLYAIASTTIGSNNLHFPYTNFSKITPASGLSSIKNKPDKKNVMNLPLALLGDPTQNFLQIFHQKPLVSGYISHASLSADTIAAITSDTLLSQMDCLQATVVNSKIITNDRQTKQIIDNLQKYNIGYLILNKEYSHKNNCDNVIAWNDWMLSHPSNFFLLDDNPYYSVFMLK